MKRRTTGTLAVAAVAAAFSAGLALTGCSRTDANVEPGLGSVQSLLKGGDEESYRQASQYVEQLDSRTRNSLTLKMLKDGNPLVVYLGAARLVREKLYDRAAPVMAELIATSGGERELQSRMDLDWRTDADPATWSMMMSRVGRILMVNMESYQPDSRKRAEYFLVTMLKLEVNKPFNKVDAATALTRLGREARP